MAPLPPGGQSRNSRVSEPPPRLEVSNKQRNSGVVVWEKFFFFFFSLSKPGCFHPESQELELQRGRHKNQITISILKYQLHNAIAFIES